MSLVISGIFLVFLSTADGVNRSHELADVQCALKNTLCNPNFTKPCCDSEFKCERTWPDHLFRCDENTILSGLGKFCELDEDCNEISHAKCSKHQKCECRMNTVRTNPWTCSPILGAFCWKNESCYADHTICTNNKCECSANYYQRSKYQCSRKIIAMPCQNDDACSEVKFAKCSEKKVCVCTNNTITVDSTYCLSVVEGFCVNTDDCASIYSVCVKNRCYCIKNYQYDRITHTCVPNFDMSVKIDIYESSAIEVSSICSKANECMCYTAQTARFDRCKPSDKIQCIFNNCKIKHTECISNFCQCNSKYIYQSARCVPLFLNGACVDNADCSEIENAVCSVDGECVCSEKYIEYNERSCRPVLDGFCTKKEDCVAINSTCLGGKCQCKPDLVKLSDSLCAIPQLGMTCDKDFDCQRIQYSRCAENRRCNCAPNYDEYNITACAPLLGRYCSNNELCAPLHSSCFLEKCLCDDGYLRHSINKCVPHYIGMECRENDDCRLLLDSKCINHVCNCKDDYAPLNSTVCAPIVGRKCTPGQQCATPNSLCILDKCQCENDYVKTPENSCVKYEEYFFKSCENENDCNDIKYSRCSPNKKCICEPNYMALGNRKCIGLIGQYCDSDDECISYDTVCVNNKCQCFKKLYAYSKHQCGRISLGLTCSKSEDCSVSIENSKCSEDGRCICKEHHYALTEFVCSPLLYGYCSSSKDCHLNSTVCIENACVCEHNFRPASDSQCMPIEHMYTCDSYLDCGDPWHYQCFKDKRCRCSPNNFSINRSTCSPLLGGYCWKFSQCLVDNSTCLDYHCQCKNGFVAVANNLCRPMADLTRIS